MTSDEPRAPSGRGDRRGLWLGVAVVLAAAAVTLAVWRPWEAPESAPAPALADDEPPHPESPYLNTRLDVKYVGDAACADCHEEICGSYRRHPMGQSLGPVGAVARVEGFSQQHRNPFEADGARYSVRQQGDQTLHVESRLGSDGQVVSELAVAVQFAVGSGQRGRSYLLSREGRLFMSPLTWYPDKGFWDLSPGYEERNSHFNRPVLEKCLFCHAHRADAVEQTLNRYAQPVFPVQHAIGCERCHGPGALHVAQREQGEGEVSGRDLTIVNPARLEPRLREAICAQCHLAGLVRVVRRGRRLRDYRPGLALDAFLAVFVDPAADGEQMKFVGHVEQMHASRCYIASGGKLGCISCHDPHATPDEQERVEFYRRRCLNCHEQQPCSADESERRGTTPADNCLQCHMPPLRTEVRHAAVTDHRLPRLPGSPPATAAAPTAADTPLAQFPAPEGQPDADAQRDLGIALLIASDEKPERIGEEQVRAAAALLEQAADRHPDDLPAVEALGQALGRAGRLSAALRHVEDVLAAEPRREFALTSAASLATGLRQFSKATAYWKRAVAVNPWIVRYRYELAQAFAREGRWADCRAVCLETIDRFPHSFGARQLLVECQLALGQGDAAQEAMERFLELNPPRREDLQRWFDDHPLRRAGR